MSRNFGGLAEWQTRRSQKAVPARACGFESHGRHAEGLPISGLMRTNCSRGCCYSDDGGGQRQRERRAWMREVDDDSGVTDAEWEMWLDRCELADYELSVWECLGPLPRGVNLTFADSWRYR